LKKEKTIELLSAKRYSKYLERCNEDHTNALQYYNFNVRASQGAYIVLEAAEVILRNQIHYKLRNKYNTDEWYNEWLRYDRFSDFHDRILSTKKILRRRKEVISPDKMVAEFTLGFWVSMFNAKYEKAIWKPLRLVFRHLHKKNRQRKTISKALNQFRRFRNRVFHYEPIVWNINGLLLNYGNVLQVIRWIDEEYFDWTLKRCPFVEVVEEETTRLKKNGVENLDYTLPAILMP
jgi:hypothetical protein